MRALTLLCLAVVGCSASAGRSPVMLASPPAARVVPQVALEERAYRCTAAGGRYAVFGELVVDLSLRRLAWAGLKEVLAPAERDAVVRRTSIDQFEAFDLRTGGVSALEPARAHALLEAVPEQAWVADSREDPGPRPRIPVPARIARVIDALELRTPAHVMDIRADASALVTASTEQVCLWSMPQLERRHCAPRAHQTYSYLADGRLLAANAAKDGTVATVLLDEQLQATREQPPAAPPVASDLHWPCGWDVEAGPYQNVFRRGDSALFTLHDLGSEWAIVLPDGRYTANVASPAALAFFDANGEPADRALVASLHQPAQVRAALRAMAHGNCPF